jgi:Ring finger domain
MEGVPYDSDECSDDGIELLADIRAHERIPNPAMVMDLSNDSQICGEVAGLRDLKRSRNDEVSILEVKPVVKALPAPTDQSECQICLETYTSGGDRRCVVTKCGHIFCFSCIEKVIANRKPCPKCRKKLGKLSTLVTIYDTAIVVADTSEVEAAQKLSGEERAKRIKVKLAIMVISKGIVNQS